VFSVIQCDVDALLSKSLKLKDRLFQAIINDQVKEVDDILDAYPEIISAKNALGYTPIFLSAMLGRASITSHLAHRGAALEEIFYVPESRRYLTPLMCAIQHNHPSVVEVLLSHKPCIYSAPLDTRMAPIHQAAVIGSLPIVQAIVKYDPNTIHTTDALGQTALYHAVLHAHVDVVRYLIDMNADVDHAVTIPSDLWPLGEMKIRPLVRKLNYEHRCNPELQNKYAEIEKIFENTEIKQLSDPSHMLLLLSTLIDIFSEKGDSSNQIEKLVRIQTWLTHRINHTIFYQAYQQEAIVDLIRGVCGFSENLWSFFAPNQVHQRAQKYLNTWLSWHSPRQAYAAGAVQDIRTFETAFANLRSIIPVNSFSSLSEHYQLNSGNIAQSTSRSPRSVVGLMGEENPDLSKITTSLI